MDSKGCAPWTPHIPDESQMSSTSTRPLEANNNHAPKTDSHMTLKATLVTPPSTSPVLNTSTVLHSSSPEDSRMTSSTDLLPRP